MSKDRVPSIDPFLEKNLNKPLWCVYGHYAFPKIICCKITICGNQLTIWGYSEYEGVPAFRTLGVSLKSWIEFENCTVGHSIKFYDEQADALSEIQRITTPKVSIFCKPDCKYLYPNEEQQDSLGLQGIAHYCHKYSVVLKHGNYHPNILKIKICDEESK